MALNSSNGSFSKAIWGAATCFDLMPSMGIYVCPQSLEGKLSCQPRPHPAANYLHHNELIYASSNY